MRNFVTFGIAVPQHRSYHWGMEATMLDNLPRGTICIEDIEMGMSRHLVKQVTDRDIALFAEVSTDRNPVHLDEAYARDTIFEGRIAHGLLTAALISAVIGEQLPGHGSVYLGQTLKPSPASTWAVGGSRLTAPARSATGSC